MLELMKELYLFLFVLSFIACQNPHRPQTSFKLAAATIATPALSTDAATPAAPEISELPFAPVSSLEESKEIFDLQSELANPENPGIHFRPAIRLSEAPSVEDSVRLVCISRASGILESDEVQPANPLDSPVLASVEENQLPLQSSL